MLYFKYCTSLLSIDKTKYLRLSNLWKKIYVCHSSGCHRAWGWLRFGLVEASWQMSSEGRNMFEGGHTVRQEVRQRVKRGQPILSGTCSPRVQHAFLPSALLCIILTSCIQPHFQKGLPWVTFPLKTRPTILLWVWFMVNSKGVLYRIALSEELETRAVFCLFVLTIKQ